MKNKINELFKFLRSGSNLLDILMLLGLFIIISTTFYIDKIVGFYLLGLLLILIPIILYKLGVGRKEG